MPMQVVYETCARRGAGVPDENGTTQIILAKFRKSDDQRQICQSSRDLVYYVSRSGDLKALHTDPLRSVRFRKSIIGRAVDVAAQPDQEPGGDWDTDTVAAVDSTGRIAVFRVLCRGTVGANITVHVTCNLCKAPTLDRRVSVRVNGKCTVGELLREVQLSLRQMDTPGAADAVPEKVVWEATRASGDPEKLASTMRLHALNIGDGAELHAFGSECKEPPLPYEVRLVLDISDGSDVRGSDKREKTDEPNEKAAKFVHVKWLNRDHLLAQTTSGDIWLLNVETLHTNFLDLQGLSEVTLETNEMPGEYTPMLLEMNTQESQPKPGIQMLVGAPRNQGFPTSVPKGVYPAPDGTWLQRYGLDVGPGRRAFALCGVPGPEDVLLAAAVNGPCHVLLQPISPFAAVGKHLSGAFLLGGAPGERLAHPVMACVGDGYRRIKYFRLSPAPEGRVAAEEIIDLEIRPHDKEMDPASTLVPNMHAAGRTVAVAGPNESVICVTISQDLQHLSVVERSVRHPDKAIPESILSLQVFKPRLDPLMGPVNSNCVAVRDRVQLPFPIAPQGDGGEAAQELRSCAVSGITPQGVHVTAADGASTMVDHDYFDQHARVAKSGPELLCLTTRQLLRVILSDTGVFTTDGRAHESCRLAVRQYVPASSPRAAPPPADVVPAPAPPPAQAAPPVVQPAVAPAVDGPPPGPPADDLPLPAGDVNQVLRQLQGRMREMLQHDESRRQILETTVTRLESQQRDTLNEAARQLSEVQRALDAHRQQMTQVVAGQGAHVGRAISSAKGQLSAEISGLRSAIEQESQRLLTDIQREQIADKKQLQDSLSTFSQKLFADVQQEIVRGRERQMDQSGLRGAITKDVVAGMQQSIHSHLDKQCGTLADYQENLALDVCKVSKKMADSVNSQMKEFEDAAAEIIRRGFAEAHRSQHEELMQRAEEFKQTFGRIVSSVEDIRVQQQQTTAELQRVIDGRLAQHRRPDAAGGPAGDDQSVVGAPDSPKSELRRLIEQRLWDKCMLVLKRPELKERGIPKYMPWFRQKIDKLGLREALISELQPYNRLEILRECYVSLLNAAACSPAVTVSWLNDLLTVMPMRDLPTLLPPHMQKPANLKAYILDQFAFGEEQVKQAVKEADTAEMREALKTSQQLTTALYLIALQKFG
eukprot:TRINITY_DN4234_c0_g1_i1.p1 TRINITY_DN4234_c0_g1~~TRINITY_DN4234_c0_g1_i1.p1  ORF type:complete len:1190 (+),score=428.18 TRINITY_DN4234_c0_g1_i1:93-3572(+)